jgi:hypothetical protein
MNTLTVDRALNIFGSLADRPEAKGAREALSEHLARICLKGEKDEHHLIIEGLSYLQTFHREIDSRD